MFQPPREEVDRVTVHQQVPGVAVVQRVIGDTPPAGIVPFGWARSVAWRIQRSAVERTARIILPSSATLPNSQGWHVHMERDVRDLKRQGLGDPQARTPHYHHQELRPGMWRRTKQRVDLVGLNLLRQLLLDCLR